MFEVDFSGIAALRAARSASGGTQGYLSYVAKAVAEALVAMPVVNASVDGDNVVYHEQVNLGIAVALDQGLIVPVIKQAELMSVDQLDAAITDLATRARSKHLSPDDVVGGTFTLTNPGSFGSVFGMPIINQPQSAILCVGAIEKRPAGGGRCGGRASAGLSDPRFRSQVDRRRSCRSVPGPGEGHAGEFSRRRQEAGRQAGGGV